MRFKILKEDIEEIIINSSSNLPNIYKYIDIKKGDIILDYNCGNSKEIQASRSYVKSKGGLYFCYNKYTRKQDENSYDIGEVKYLGGANIIVNSEEIIITETILKDIYNLLRKNGKAYLNTSIDYIEDIKEIFDENNVISENNLIIATKIIM